MSIELTDEIRTKVFTASMNSEDFKLYDENFALAVLRYCFNDYDDLMVIDSPDLQSPDHSVGIEVTEITTSSNAAISGDFVNFRKTGKIKYKEKIEKNGGTATNYSVSYLPVTEDDEMNAIEIVFRKKLKKLKKYKNKGFKKLGLIMLMSGPPIPTVALNWGDLIYKLQSSSNYKYDMIFFAYSSALSILDCSTGKTDYIHIKPDDLDALKRYARIKAEESKNHSV